MNNKIEMYRAIEQVCVSNHDAWNAVQGFPGAFSRFVVKLVKLDMLSNDPSGNNAVADLMSEIDNLLRSALDVMVEVISPANQKFYTAYVDARTNSRF